MWRETKEKIDMVRGSKSVGRLSLALTGERAPGKRGIVPTAILGTGVLVSLTALDTQLLGGRLTSIFSFPLPGTGTRIGLIDIINGLIFFQGPKRARSAITAVLGSKIITGAVNIGTLIPGISGGLPSGIAAAGGSSGVAAGSTGAPV